MTLSLTLVCPAVGHPPRGHSIKGEVEHDPHDPVDDLRIELYDQVTHSLVDRASVMPDGSFELQYAENVSYEVRLVDDRGQPWRANIKT